MRSAAIADLPFAVFRSFIRTCGPLAAGLLLVSATALPAQTGDSPADRLSRYLRELTENPRDLSALIGAGQAAIGVGDGNAALGFFGRADEISPRNPQVKAGLARALLLVDNPRDAIKMFDQAVSLGVPEAEIAGDRGLAYDLRGDPKRAQKEYQIALARGPNDEVTRRYALSLGITGDRETALKLLDPLLYKRDQGAWRARAFIMAMTGDSAGAEKIVRQVMPDRMADAMAPFLVRLATLKPAEKAAAVHFGDMPETGVRYAAQPDMPNPMPVESSVNTRQPLAPGRDRIGAELAQAARPAPTPTPTPEPRLRPSAAYAAPTPAPTPVRLAEAETPKPVPTPTPSPAASHRGDLDAIMRDIRASSADNSTKHGKTVKLAKAEPKPTPTPTPSAKSKASAKEKAAKGEDEEATPAKGKKGKLAAKEKAEPKAPARYWVQVAGGANEDDLPKTWHALVKKEPALFKGHTPWTTPLRATNRLLTGPFKDEDEAQAFVNRLHKAGLTGFSWQSADGQEIEKLPTK